MCSTHCPRSSNAKTERDSLRCKESDPEGFQKKEKKKENMEGGGTPTMAGIYTAPGHL